MANIIEDRGVFWWFRTADGHTASLETAIPGTLTISEEGHIRLQLEGPLWYEDPEAYSRWDESRWFDSDKRIAGRLSEYQHPFVLLQDLVRTDFSLSDDKPVRQSYEADLCFTSDLPYPVDFGLESFAEVRVDLEGLEEWLKLDRLRVEDEWRQGHKELITISYEDQPIAWELPTAAVSLESFMSGLPLRIFSDGPEAEIKLRQTHSFVYTPKEKRTLFELQTALVRLEEFIALLLGRHFRLAWPIFVSNKGDDELWCTLYSYRGPRGEDLSWPAFLWTSFAAVRGEFGEMLSRWYMNVELYEASYDLYVASLRSPLPHGVHDFVNLIWVVESLHRSWEREAAESATALRRKSRIGAVLDRFTVPKEKKLKKWLEGKLRYAFEPTLEERIFESFKRLPIGINRLQLRRFAQRCAKRRNQISHEGGHRLGEDVSIFRSETLVLAEALRHLLHALLLHENGLPAGILLKAMTQSVLAERSILPSLDSVQIDLTIATSEK
jgi:hypothetical protein